MAFLTTNNIGSSLPLNFDEVKVEFILLSIEKELKQRGLVFTEPQESQIIVDASRDYPQAIFDFEPIKDITGIKIKNYEDSGETLIDSSDYVLDSHPNFSNYTVRLGLSNKSIKLPCYLEITGKYGLYIDFNDSNDFGSKLLKSIIIDYTNKVLTYQKSGYRDLTTAKTGESSASFKSSNNRAYYSSIFSDPEYYSQLEYFLC